MSAAKTPLQPRHEQAPAEAEHGRSWRRAAVALGLLVAVGVAAAIVLVAGSSSPRAAGGTHSVGGAAVVQRRNLVQTDTESGTISYADPQTVYDRLSGTITWLPRVGALIKPGGALYSVNGRPVVLFAGALSAYRTLSAKDGAGQDLLQLNRDLVQMGFADGQVTIDDAWQTGTTEAVKRWQASVGERQTGRIALGRIVFLPGAQRVTQLESTCGSTGGAGGGTGPIDGCGVSQISTTAPPGQAEAIDFTASAATAPAETATVAVTSTPVAPSTTTATASTSTTSANPTTTTQTTTTSTTTSTAQQPSEQRNGNAGQGAGGSGGNASGHGSHGSAGSDTKASAGSGKAAAGSGGSARGGKASAGGAQSAAAIMQTTSTKLVVTVDLPATSQSEAVIGAHVTVEMPDGSTIGGRIAAVSAVAQSSPSGSEGGGPGGSGGGGGSGGSGAAATIPVTIKLERRVKGAGVDQAVVSVEFAAARAKHVLCVPVTALVARAGGSYALQEAAAPHRLLPVRTGLYAAGYVQISGAEVHPGLKVTDSQG